MLVKPLLLGLVAFLVSASTAHSQEQTFENFIASLDGRTVLLDGNVSYLELNGGFVYTSNADATYPMVIDAGRDAREFIKEHCRLGVLIGREELSCSIEAVGTVVFHEGQVELSMSELINIARGSNEVD